MGGKFQQRHSIVNLLPRHTCYVEVFSGGAHVLLAKPPSISKVEVLNDINNNLMHFWLVSRDYGDLLVEMLNNLPYSRTLYQQWKNEPLPSDSLEKAVRWFYICWAYSGQYSFAKEFRCSTELIKGLKDRLKNVLIECVDFRQIISKYDNKDTIFFADPPYDGQLNKEHYYGRKHNIIPQFNEQDHIDLATLLNNIKGKALVCYYPTDLIKELYPEPKWTWLPYKKVLHSRKADGKTKKPYKEEVILMNYHMLEHLFSEDKEELE